MVTDPISDLFTQIRNGYMASKAQVSLPYSRLKETIIKVMVAEKFVDSYEVQQNGLKKLVVNLKYDHKQPAITEIKRVSRPSLRVYANKNSLPSVLGGMGVAIISTPKGVMTDKQARRNNVGGEVICKIW